tara:strand:- start:7153 stop:7362 length:210 start_codon:yes stop_codon:yes gene_type:complete
MKYGLILGSDKVIAIKEVHIDRLNLKLTITSMKDEVYIEQYTTSEEVLDRLLQLNGGFNSRNIKTWWNS